MKRQLIRLDPDTVPVFFRPLLDGTDVYDSSCSAAARVYFIDKEGGCYLKTAPKGALRKEAELTRYFHSKGLAAQVLEYRQEAQDWLLTSRVSGEDCTHKMYLADPKRLCDTTAQLLRRLHGTDCTGCPIPDRTAEYYATARRNYEAGTYDIHLFPDNWGFRTPEEAWHVVEENACRLSADTLIHGDYCLPNIMLDNWRFSGFIDLDAGGIGDRHADLFWGLWSLCFNLKTNRYRDRFLDAYGRENVNEELLRVIAAFEVFG